MSEGKNALAETVRNVAASLKEEGIGGHAFFLDKVADYIERHSWKDIALAPKDGTLVLGCSLPYQKTNWGILDQYRAPRAVRWGAYHPNAPGKECWRAANGKPMHHLTHWQPLPNPPKE